MRAIWTFRAVRRGCNPGQSRRTIRHGNHERVLCGTERDALDFARRACEYLRPNGVELVEAWSIGEVTVQNDESGILGLVQFCLKPHRNGRDWIAEPNELHHGGWWQDLEQAIDYALFRGSGKLCAIHVLRARAHQTVILSDQTTINHCPTIPPRIVCRS